MPVTRRSTGGGRAKSGPGQGQSTISFASKVTKSVPRDAGKKAVLAETPLKKPASASVSPAATSPSEAESPVADKPSPYAEQEIPEDAEKSEVELRAEQVTDAQVLKYWRSVLRKRITNTVHQEGLSTGEKVLRYFDMSSEYGPCIGMPRIKRWQRAERLGLNPPIEVLAVLLKEENKTNVEIERASMDIIMNSIAVGSH